MNQLFELKNKSLTSLDSAPFKLEKEIQNIIKIICQNTFIMQTQHTIIDD